MRARHIQVSLVQCHPLAATRKSRSLRVFLSVIALSIPMLGCSGGTADSGLEGTSVAAGKPVPAAIQIYTRASTVPGGGADYDARGYGQLVGSVTSDNAGHFKVTLAPGDYVVSATAPNASGRSAAPTYATVQPHLFAPVTVGVDNPTLMNP
jgi:hypothetical protein